ncbi:hypothetical protein COCON_G00008310 [Conger conger]|uniref:Uncharacterized protein n=1 Tax=Conger conger TaxID=82655 RepID=A0A9Q1E1Y7_CONCO|nr:uncharacterized protein LOC133106388 [Conger conger]KAJ8288172.1 hypothetical protein COCON_G00008310 [Conger conger]
MSPKTLFSLAVLLVVVATVAGGLSSSSKGGTYTYDLSKLSDLTKLYNSGVHKAERLKRPLDGWSTTVGVLSHSGVRVTLADGSQWLVHKGDNFGIKSNTVVVDVKHMSDKWKVVETKDFEGRKTVSDFVKAGGTDYSLIFDNCHSGAGRMMKQ